MLIALSIRDKVDAQSQPHRISELSAGHWFGDLGRAAAGCGGGTGLGGGCPPIYALSGLLIKWNRVTG